MNTNNVYLRLLPLTGCLPPFATQASTLQQRPLLQQRRHRICRAMTALSRLSGYGRRIPSVSTIRNWRPYVSAFPCIATAW